MGINTMINKKLIVNITPRGAFLAFTLLSALAVSGCGDKNEREFMRGCKSEALLPPSADVSGMT